MTRTARMSDVAKLAQVSTMTVSRVLNENPNVLEETRRRVFEAIEQLGYRRNELARSLRDRRTRQIGILVPNLYDAFFAQCAHTVSAVAKAHEYSVSIATTDEDPEAEFEEASRMALRKVEGLVAIPAEGAGGTSRLRARELAAIPLVVLDRPVEGDGKPPDTLLVQNKRGAQVGTEHLLSLGHKRVVFLGLEGPLYTMRKRQEGYRAAMTAAGLRAASVLVSAEADTMHARLRELLGLRHAPTAMFCANNLITQRVLHGLQRLGIYAPEGMALVGFDDFDAADLLRPGVTVVRQPVESLARMAGEVLFARLAGAAEKPGKRIVLPVELVVRGSCGTRSIH